MWLGKPHLEQGQEGRKACADERPVQCLQVDRTRLSVTAVADGWSPNWSPQGDWGTGSGLQANSSTFIPWQLGKEMYQDNDGPHLAEFEVL